MSDISVPTVEVPRLGAAAPVASAETVTSVVSSVPVGRPAGDTPGHYQRVLLDTRTARSA